ncbi:hypothetical protein VTJ83DRAFT_5705 [Remersonia thermophila]|uniref:Uncharacterized protein n=1 Tax=Remersonia thermophila TaxID=72144 RepID=A0ABR4D7Q7_9PEZI
MSTPFPVTPIITQLCFRQERQPCWDSHKCCKYHCYNIGSIHYTQVLRPQLLPKSSPKNPRPDLGPEYQKEIDREKSLGTFRHPDRTHTLPEMMAGLRAVCVIKISSDSRVLERRRDGVEKRVVENRNERNAGAERTRGLAVVKMGSHFWGGRSTLSLWRRATERHLLANSS